MDGSEQDSERSGTDGLGKDPPTSVLRRIARWLRGDAPPAPDLAPPPSTEPGDASGAICERLREWVCEISTKKRFVSAALDPDAAIFDAGYVDSMSYVELLARIEARYGVTVPDEQVIGTSLNRLAVYVAAQAAPDAPR